MVEGAGLTTPTGGWTVPAAPADPTAPAEHAVPESAAAPAPAPAPAGAPASGAVGAGSEAPAPAAATSGGLTLTDVRRLWPDILDSVKLKRRFTWILLSQNAQVADVDDKTLTVALVNNGARSSFMSGGSEEILRQAAIDVVGHDWRIEAIVDPSAQPGEGRVTVTSPAVAAEPPAPSAAQPPPAGGAGPGGQGAAGGSGPAPAGGPAGRAASGGPGGGAGTRSVDPSAVANARQAIQETRPQGPRAAAAPVDHGDDDVDPDDPSADDHLGGAQLLQRELGASIIEEIRHD